MTESRWWTLAVVVAALGLSALMIWEQGPTRDIVGAIASAVALAIVSTKEPEHFRTSPGGYFHGMVAKARAGELHLERTVWALRRASEPDRHPRSGRAGERLGRDGGEAW